ncbi:BamA/TamA family outer membrane protein [Escherichia coli]|uniref:BamA/TamA family outer membrane protein n=1 Tax=Escherichia coli TaxID=562 RepID=UPI00208FE228|nr:BamA/TamA family outer membrane protein [Escherichia coli]
MVRQFLTGLFFCLMMLPLAAVAGGGTWQERIDSILTKPEQGADTDWGVLAGPFYSPEMGAGVGLVQAAVYQASKQSGGKNSAISVTGFASLTGAFGVELNNYSYLDNDTWRFYLNGVVNKVPTDYWGRGYRAGYVKKNFGEYIAEQQQLSPSFLFRIADNTYIGTGWKFNSVNAVSVNPAFRKYMSEHDYQQHSVSSGASVIFSYDSRDFLLNAHRGQGLDVRYTWYSPFLGSDERFSTTEVQYNYYYSLDDRTVLAFDNYARFVSGHVPWDQFSHLGNGRQMRGYYDGRYQDNHVFAFQMEYRRKLAWRHGITFWVGGGTMSKTVGHLGYGHWLPDAGIGYRFEFKPRMNVRLDFGIGKRSCGFYFQTGEAF